MKLNQRGRNELRREIEEQLQYVPQDQRVHLDKELLEELLFETVVYNKKTNSIVKLPFWSGHFLSKIDLSEVNFDDVSWTLLSDIDGQDIQGTFDDNEQINKFLKLLDEVSKIHSNSYYVDYSNTNAKIDFTKSFECKNSGPIQIEYVNFDGVDFSNLNLNMFDFICYCNLSNTGIKISDDLLDYAGDYRAVKFENLDFSKISISAKALIEERLKFALQCDFTNTGLNIIYKPNEFKSQDDGIFKSEYIFAKYIKSGKLDGCYINGKKVNTKQEWQKIAQEKKEEYNKMKENLINSTICSIKEQINVMKK